MTDARPPEPMKEPRSWRLRRLRAAGLFALAMIAAWIYEPWSRSGPPLCLVRLITGVPCPGCGMTRSVCAASHGHWSDALAFHWLGPLALAVMAGGLLVALFEASSGRRLDLAHRCVESRSVAWTIAVVLLVRWGWRTADAARSGELEKGLRTSPLGALLSTVRPSQGSAPARPD